MDSSSKKNAVVYIPDELIINILQRLPLKSLMRFKCVCKKWRNFFGRNKKLIFVPSLSDDYEVGILKSEEVDLKASKLEAVRLDFPLPLDCWYPHRTRVMGFCDDLVCIRIHKKEKEKGHVATAIVWNPSLRRYKNVPIPIHGIIPKQGEYFFPNQFGLGYDHCTQDYKIVRLYQKLGSQQRYETFFQTYSLKNDSWEREATLPWVIDFHSIDYCQAGISVNGSLYWPIKLVEDMRDCPCILCFDLPDQKFRLIHSPVDDVGYFLGFGGRLCMVIPHYTPDGNYNDIDIWIMEEEEEKEKETQNWIKLMTIPNVQDQETLQLSAKWISETRVVCLINGEVLMMIRVWIPRRTLRTTETKFVLYNNEDNTFRKFEIEGVLPSFSPNVIYTESLIYLSLHLQYLR